MTTKTTGTAVEVLEQTNAPAVRPEDSFLTIFQVSAEKGFEPAFIEKMMELQERNDANNARKAFFAAVAAFKENPPEVLKDKENSQFSKANKKAMYVSLGNLVKTVNPALGAHGLSASWTIEQGDKMVKVSCKLSHKLGHSEQVTMEAPPDDSGGNAKNPIQKIKSTITYLRGATFEAVTGLAAIDGVNLDDDGNGAGGVKYITEAQVKVLQKGLAEKGIKEGRITKFMGVEGLENILALDYGKAMSSIEATPAKPQKETAEPEKRTPGEDDGEWMDEAQEGAGV